MTDHHTTTIPPTPSPARPCKDGCGRALPRGSGMKKYLEGHAPNFARALDVSDMSPESIAAFWNNVQIADNGMCLKDAAAKGFLRRKLTASQVLEIRALRQAGAVSRGTIAEQFGISSENVYLITAGRSWRHLLEPGAQPIPTRRPWILKAACLRGHAFTPQNTAIRSNGDRRCRQCNRLAAEKHRRLTQPNPAPLKRLTPEIVRAIRAKAVAGVIDAALAREFGLPQQTVHKIVNRLSWRHLDPDAPTPLATRARMTGKMACLRGHTFDMANTRILPNGQRVCRACDRQRARERRVA